MAKGIKTGGRQKGAPNLLTKELRLILKNIIANELVCAPDLMEKLEPKERLEMVIKLIPYALPKIEPINMDKGEPLYCESDWQEK